MRVHRASSDGEVSASGDACANLSHDSRVAGRQATRGMIAIELTTARNRGRLARGLPLIGMALFLSSQTAALTGRCAARIAETPGRDD